MAQSSRKNRNKSKTTRRAALVALGAAPLAFLAPRLAHATRTPSASEGPFYPTKAMRFADADNDLVKIDGAVKEAGGEVIVLKGRILDAGGKPVDGARIEIWQCDANGRYLHTGDRGGPARDAGFQGFGHVVTGPDGVYAFRTIKPVPYPGRAPHIHVKVVHGNRELTTQFYIDGHALNERDWLFGRMSRREQRAVNMVFSDGADGPETVVDVRL